MEQIDLDKIKDFIALEKSLQGVERQDLLPKAIKLLKELYDNAIVLK